MRYSKVGFLAGLVCLGIGAAALAGETVTYTYDALGRLVKVDHSGSVNNGVSSSYAYDRASNRTNVTVQGSAPLITNASFELPVLAPGGYVYSPSVAGATFSVRSGVQSNGSAWEFPNTTDGTQTAFLQDVDGHGGSIVLTVQYLVPGQGYCLSARLAKRAPLGPTTVVFTFAGQQILTATPTSSSAFVQFTGTRFVASSTSGSLTLSSSPGSGDTGAGIDSLALTIC